MPGGKFTAKQNGDGTWNVENLAIFAQHKVKFGDEEKEVGKDWLFAAKAKEDSRVANDDYLPPLHIHHHGVRETTRAGFFRSKAVAQAKYQGKLLWMTFADLVRIPSAVYRKIKAGELPYRSVEIHSLDEPEINSLALLDDEVPFFRLSLLTIGKEIPVEGLEVGKTIRAMNAESAPLLAYRALGNGSNVLMNLDSKLLRRQDMVNPEDEEKKKREEEEKKKGENLADDQGELAKGLASIIAMLQSMMQRLAGGETEETPEDGGAPAPAENLSAKPPKKGSESSKGKDYAADLSKLPEAARAPMAKMMGRVDALEHKSEVETAVFTATKELVTYGLDQEKTGKTLFSIAIKAGIPAMQSYAQAVRDHGTKDPAPDVDGSGDLGADLPKEMQVFANQGQEVLEEALKYSKEFDAHKEHGLKMEFGRQRYVADCLEAKGHKVEIPEEKED